MRKSKRTLNGILLAWTLVFSQAVGLTFGAVNVSAEETVEVESVETVENETVEEEVSNDQADDEEIIVNEGDNEESDPDTYVYVEETKCHFTFLIMSNGIIHKAEEPNNLTAAGNMYSAVNPMAINQIMVWAGDNDILGWELGINGHAGSVWLTDDFKDESTNTDYQFEPNMDYTLTAALKRASASNLFVEAVPAVYYDGRAHVSFMETLSSADKNKSIGDLEMPVLYLPNGAAYEDAILLRPGKDYKLTYKNNVNASMKMTDEGTYESCVPEKKRPCVQITGINEYAGFSTDVYFDILPYNFGEHDQYQYDGKYNAQYEGIDTSYTLKNGKLTKAVSPKVTFYNAYTGKRTTLKAGTDYEVRLYRYDESSKWIYKDSVTETGRWLCTVRGKGNFCGTLFGQAIYDSNAVFNDGTKPGGINPAVCNYTGASVPNGQFRVEDSERDLSKAKVTVKNKSVPYVHGRTYTGTELGLKVSIGGYTLSEGIDYRVIYDGDDFTYLTGKYTSTGVFTTSVNKAVFNDEIWMANKYKVKIEAVAGNPNGYYGSQDSNSTVTIKGIKIQPGWFKLSTASRKYDGTYGAGGSFTCDPRMKVVDISNTVDSYLSGHYTDSSNYRTYDYSGGVKAVFNNSAYTTSYYDYGVMVLSEYAKLPGSYKRRVIPFGPGVDHSQEAEVGFKIKPISMKEAAKNNIIKVAATEGKYNAGGALPGLVTITFNGKVNNLNMNFNDQLFYIYDKNNDHMLVKLTATGNTAPGKGYITVTAGDSKTLTGSLSKATYFNIYKCDVTSPTIRVLENSDYLVSYGKRTDMVAVTASEPVGTLYATMQPVAADKNGNFPSKYKIDLFQSYSADGDGYYGNRAALKKLSPSQYTLTPTPSSPNSFTVKVSTGKDGVAKTGFNFTTTTTLSKDYDVYNEGVKITSVTVTYAGDSYTLPADSKKLVTQYKGSQVKFDAVTEVRVSSKTDGETTVPVSDCTITYGDNIKAGKNTGTMTVTLKKGTGGYKYGAEKTFNFTIKGKDKVTM
ncbi:MAG: hypothetical protein J5910_08905 [Lachnospiraceae bacterium]|nr:hypothetical protein [Lachnospiraceae bacterium]